MSCRFGTKLRPRKRVALALCIAVVSLLLVAGQTVAVSHSDFDGHPAGEACALCVSLAHLGAGNVAAAIKFEFASSSPLLEEHEQIAVAARDVGVARARGPPATF